MKGKPILMGMLTLCLAIALSAVPGQLSSADTAKPQPAEIEKRIMDILSQMTLEEKIDMLSGIPAGGYAGAGYIKPNPRIGIPGLKLTDGPAGVRWGQSTAFPAPIAMAATWDPDLVEEIGSSIGREARSKDQRVLLAPCINILRVPQGGRSFEAFGEDPYLTARMTVSYVKGVQEQGVIACVKHFACNNQESERGSINAEVDERTLREIYLPAFRAAVQEAGVWSVMAAYNKVNGTYCSENSHILTDILKNEWGFKGFVVSDWGATHSTVAAANAGLDLEMPTGEYFGRRLLGAVKRGEVSESLIDDKVSRILRAMFSVGIFDELHESPKPEWGAMNEEDMALTRKAAGEGVVLLKNDGILPLDRDAVRSIAVVGPNAAVARVGGGGSAYVNSPYSISPLEAFWRKGNGKISIRYAEGCGLGGSLPAIDSSALVPPDAKEGEHGLRGEYFNNTAIRGKPALTRIDREIDFDWASGSPALELSADEFSVRWTGKLIPPATGRYQLGFISDDGIRLYLDGKLIIDNWSDHAAEANVRTVELEAQRPYDIKIEYYENRGLAVAKLIWGVPEANEFNEAASIAAQSDVAIVFVGLSNDLEGEGKDREDLSLPSSQDDLIEAIVKANPNTIVVLNNGGPVLMDRWADKVAAIVEAWYPGQEGGNAIADVLFGDVNPSGKLPMTFPKAWEDSPVYGTYPGSGGIANYSEGIFIGYRHFDKENIKPLFPFGHGLSYTTFAYSNLQIAPGIIPPDGTVTVSLDLQNTGSREGSEVVQLYVRDVKASVERPVKELKGFKKVTLKPGEKKRVALELEVGSLAFYDVEKKGWVVEPGRFEVMVGSSSRDIRLTGDFDVQGGTS